MRISNAAARELAASEGFSATPYRKRGDVWTIGYGSTRGVGPNTPPVTPGQAFVRMVREVNETYGAAVNDLGIPLNQNQFDALCLFVYNLGPGAIAGDTGIGRALRARRYREAADEMLRWDHGPPGTEEGLRARRRRERALFLRPMPDLYRNLPEAEKAAAHKIEHHREQALLAPKGSKREKDNAVWRERYKRRARRQITAIKVAARTPGLGGWKRKAGRSKLSRGARVQLLERAVKGVE